MRGAHLDHPDPKNVLMQCAARFAIFAVTFGAASWAQHGQQKRYQISACAAFIQGSSNGMDPEEQNSQNDALENVYVTRNTLWHRFIVVSF